MEGTIRRNTKVIERICLRSKAGSRVGWARLYLFFIISPLFTFIFLDMCIFHFDKHKILSIKNSTLSSLPESVPDSSRVVNVKQWEWGMNSGKPRVWSPIGCLQSHSLGKILARIGTIKKQNSKPIHGQWRIIFNTTWTFSRTLKHSGMYYQWALTVNTSIRLMLLLPLWSLVPPTD